MKTGKKHLSEMEETSSAPLRIAIIGAGFSGTALAAALYRQADKPCEIFLYEKTGRFGAGEAYKTPFPFHLLNVRAKHMSIFEDEQTHYVDWLRNYPEKSLYVDDTKPIEEQFTPRLLYGLYLKHLLDEMQAGGNKTVTVHLQTAEVVDIKQKPVPLIMLENGRQQQVNKIVFALGNQSVTSFPFPVAKEMKCIHHSWDYIAPTFIQPDQNVMIVGTGLSMIDTVLTLYKRQHKGKIYTVSRHGLLPLPHAHNEHLDNTFQLDNCADIRAITKYLRSSSADKVATGGDWRSLISAMNLEIPLIWSRLSDNDKRRFMHHLLPYWNIHRHRVHNEIAAILENLIVKKQLEVIPARIQRIEKKSATICVRGSGQLRKLSVDWLINCMGPSNNIRATKQPLLQKLFRRKDISTDSMNLGFDMTPTGALKNVDGQVSSVLFAIGSARRGMDWAASSVPEIRPQIYQLASHLLQQSGNNNDNINDCLLAECIGR